MQLPLSPRKLAVAALSALLAFCSLSWPSHSQDLRDKINDGTLGVVTGSLEGTYARIASDLSRVLDDGSQLRILPILGKGSIQNIADILYLRGVDIGIVQSDVFSFMKREGIFPSVDERIHYISKLYNEEVHLLVHNSLKDLKELNGKKVSFGTEGRFYMTGSVIFDHLGIRVEPVGLDPAVSLEMIKSQEIAAMLYVSGKPTRFFREILPDMPVKFMSLPLTPTLLEIYLPTRLTRADYPELIAQDEQIDTLAVSAVMAVFNSEVGSERYRKVARFVDAFFSHIEHFKSPARHPKWREVSLTAQVPGWTRFKAAEEWLSNN